MPQSSPTNYEGFPGESGILGPPLTNADGTGNPLQRTIRTVPVRTFTVLNSEIQEIRKALAHEEAHLFVTHAKKRTETQQKLPRTLGTHYTNARARARIHLSESRGSSFPRKLFDRAVFLRGRLLETV